MSFQLTRLNNGLTIVSDSLTHVQTAAVGVWVTSGARHESLQTMGISHFLEHMAFKGTKTRSAQDIAFSLETVGGHMNAYTSRESTAYYMRVLGNDLPLAIEILADILQNSLFSSEEIEKERQVILQEIYDANDQPDDKVFDAFFESAFGLTPMGWPILGTPETVSSFTFNHLKKHMAARYRGPHMVVVATGLVDHQKLVDQVSREFEGISSEPSLPTEPGFYTGGERHIHRDLEQLHTLQGYKAFPIGHASYSASAVFATLLGGGMSSRLFQEVREKRGLVYSIYSFISAFKDCGVLGIYAGTSPDKYTELKKVLQGEIEKLASFVPMEEVERAKAQLKASLMMAWESIPTRAEQLANQVLVYGRPLEMKEIASRIDAVTQDKVLAYGQSLLDSPQTLSLLGPVGKMEG